MKTIKNLKSVVSIVTFALVMLVTLSVYAQENKIGQQHNIDLEEILNQLSEPIESTKEFNAESKRQEVITIAKEKYGKKFHSLIDELSTFSDPYNLLNSFQKRMSKEIYNQVYSDLNQIKLLNSESEINNFIVSLKSNKSNMSTQDNYNYNNFLSVLENSNQFWFSENRKNILEMKGFGSESSTSAKNGIKWWKVIACDAVGAIGGAIIAGASTAGIGTGAGALVGGVVASGCSAINQY